MIEAVVEAALLAIAITALLYFLIVPWFILRIAPKDGIEEAKERLHATSAVDALLLHYKQTGQTLESRCPQCESLIQVRVNRSLSKVRLDCQCGACDGTYKVEPL